MIRLGSLFSGIGSVEQALLRLGIDHEIAFACDNGDVELKLLPKKEQYRLDELKKSQKSKTLSATELSELSQLMACEAGLFEHLRKTTLQLSCPAEKKDFVDKIYSKHSRQTNFVKRSYLANYNIDEANFHLDVRLLDGRDYEGQIDLIVGGSPCQSFSTVGRQLGFEDTRGTLFYEFARLVKEVRPKAFIYENVNGLTKNDGGRTLAAIKRIFREDLHYRVADEQILNASDFGIPQTRRRLFLIGIRDDIHCADFRYPKPTKLRYSMQDFLENNCGNGHFNFDSDSGDIVIEPTPGHPSPKFNLTPGVQKYVLASGTKNFKTSVKTNLPIARTLLKTMTQQHRASIDNYITVSKSPLQLRALTDRECLRLMGYPDTFKIVVSPAQIYRQAGNSIVVDVMMALLRSLIDTNVFTYET